MPETWNDCREGALRDLRDRFKEYRDEFGPAGEDGDVIHEIADGAVPVYNADRMSVAADPDVWGSDPDAGLYEGSSDLMQIVGVYIYEALSQALWSELEDLREQEAEAEAEAEENPQD